MATWDKRKNLVELSDISTGQVTGMTHTTGVKLVLAVQPRNLPPNQEEHHLVKLQLAVLMKS